MDNGFWDAVVLMLWIVVPPVVILNVAGVIWLKMTSEPRNSKPIKKTIIWRDDV